VTSAALRDALARSSLPLARSPPVEPMPRLDAPRRRPRLFVKRDDAMTFGFGGNKVRKRRSSPRA
jgi:1-aminocyclopropane-1-carboxylate deaminase/D-cysteine desulfhydrase-like pyridoxal-dependent ACC family enzyme